MSNPPTVIIQYYFNKKRAFATGISLTGHSVGHFTMLPLLRLLIQEYGVRSAMMLHAGIVLQNVVLGALFRPLRKSDTFQSDTELNTMEAGLFVMFIIFFFFLLFSYIKCLK